MLSLWHISEKVRPCTISLISSFLFFISPFLGFCFHTQTTLNYYFCKSQVFLNCNAFLPSFLYKNRVSVPWFLWIRYQTILPKWKRRLKKSVVYEICKFWASGIHLCTYIHYGHCALFQRQIFLGEILLLFCKTQFFKLLNVCLCSIMLRCAFTCFLAKKSFCNSS